MFKDPLLPEDIVISPNMQSDNFVEAVSGWRVTDNGLSQFDNLQVINNINASDITTANVSTDSVLADTVVLAGKDLGTSLANLKWSNLTTEYPRGIVGAHHITNSDIVVGSVDKGVIAASFIAVINRSYKITARVTINRSDSGSRWASHSRIKKDAVPVVTDDKTDYQWYTTVDGTYCTVLHVFYYRPTLVSETGTIWASVWLSRDIALGTAAVNSSTSRPWLCSMVIEDIGMQLSQLPSRPTVGYQYLNPVPVPAPDPPPPAPATEYRSTYYSNWSRSFDGDGSTTWDDSAYCYHGYYSSARGNSKALVGFDDSLIRSNLSGATVTRVQLVYRVSHTYAGSGAPIYVGGHNASSKPASVGTISPGSYDGATHSAGEHVTIDLPLSFGNALKAGTQRGITFGPGPTTSLTYYAYIEGATMTYKPRLVIEYTK